MQIKVVTLKVKGLRFPQVRETLGRVEICQGKLQILKDVRELSGNNYLFNIYAIYVLLDS